MALREFVIADPTLTAKGHNKKPLEDLLEPRGLIVRYDHDVDIKARYSKKGTKVTIEGDAEALQSLDTLDGAMDDVRTRIAALSIEDCWELEPGTEKRIWLCPEAI